MKKTVALILATAITGSLTSCSIISELRGEYENFLKEILPPTDNDTSDVTETTDAVTIPEVFPDVTATDTTAEDTTAADTTAEDTTAEDTTATDTTAEDTTAADTTATDTTATDTTAEDTTAEDTTAEDTTTADTTAADTTAADTTAADTTAADTTAAPSAMELLLAKSNGEILAELRFLADRYSECLMDGGMGVETEREPYYPYFTSAEEAQALMESNIRTEEYLSKSKGLMKESDPAAEGLYKDDMYSYHLITNYKSYEDIRATYSQWIIDETVLYNGIFSVMNSSMIYEGKFYMVYGPRGYADIFHDYDNAKLVEKSAEHIKVEVKCYEFDVEATHMITFTEHNGSIVISKVEGRCGG